MIATCDIPLSLPLHYSSKKSNDYRYKLQVACNRYIVTLIDTRYDPTLIRGILHQFTYAMQFLIT